VEGFIEAGPLGPTEVKGITGPVELFELTSGPAWRSAWHVRAARGLSELVGRESELEVLERALAEVKGGRGRVVSIIGEPGLGKSRLAHELARAAAAQGWTVLEAGASPHDRNTTYFAIRGLLRAWFAVGIRDTQGEIADKLRAGVASLDDDLAALLPALGSLLDLPPDAAWLALEPPQRRRQIIDAVTTLILRRSRNNPLMLLVEDLHWSDAETETVLDRLVAASATERLLLLETHRPEYRHEWPSQGTPISIRLEPLAADAADRLLVGLLGDAAELTSLRHLLVERTDRTPLFIEEAVRSLAETGTFAGERGRYRLVRPIDDINVPTTVQAVLAARIDRLPMAARSLIQIASVIGAEVPVDQLRSICDLDPDELQQCLTELCSTEFLFELRPAPELSYGFKHALVRDVAYHGILRERRRVLHARLVAAIEARHRDRLDEHIERLAHHAWNGDLWEKASAYLSLAGDRAVERSAYRQAAGFYRQVLEALRRIPANAGTIIQAIDIRLKLRPTLATMGETQLILGYLREAEDLAIGASDHRRLVFALIHQSYFHSVQGNIELAVATSRRAADIARELPDRPLATETRIALGQAYCFGGALRPVIETIAPDLDYLVHELRHERFGQLVTRSVMALTNLANAHEGLGAFSMAIDLSGAGCAVADETRRPADVQYAQLRLGSAFLHKGDLEQALPILGRAEAAMAAGEIWFNRALATAYIGHAHVLQGAAAEGVALIRRAVEQCTTMGLIRHEAWCRAYLSHALLRCDAQGEATPQARQALDMARRQKFLDLEAFALRLLGMSGIAGDRDRAGDGERCLHEAIALAEARELRPELAHAHGELGRFCARTGRLDDALRHLGQASSLYRAMDMRFWLEQIEAPLGG
jgi:tetratricopeptide (TPR) repeat protein